LTPAPMPEEYDLELVAERLEPATRGGVAIGFIMGGKQATVNLDAGGQKLTLVCGLDRIDGVDFYKNPTRVEGSRLPLNEKQTIRVEVRKQGVRVFAAQDRIIDWQGKPEQLAPSPSWKIPPGKLFLGAEAMFRICSLSLTPT
jgi:hypothetical protein